MKKKFINRSLFHDDLRKTLRRVKLLITFFFLGLLTVSATTYSQQTKFEMNLEGVTIRQVFRQIEDQSEFIFFYNEAYVDLDRKVNVHVDGERVERILDDILKGTGNIYKIHERQIVIVPGSSKSSSVQSEADDQTEKTITGRIVDQDGMPLPGASIVVKGTTNGAASNIDGEFTLTIPNDETVTLIAQFIGYDAQEIIVGDKTSIDIVMTADDLSIDEVVVIGYGSVRKVDLTGAVATVSEKDFNMGGPVTTPEELIQGRAAGVQVSTVSAAPGSEPIIRIRGNNSILGSNQPLYVVDGLPMNSLDNMVNVQDIQSMQILKDASSTAIYGTRGANGVVIITTKRGKKGSSNIDYSFEQTYDIAANLDAYEFSNAQEYMATLNSLAELRNAPNVPYGPERIATINKYGEGTQWINELTRTGKIQKHNLSVSSGSENSSTFLSVHYMDQEGIVPQTNFNKLTSKFNYDQKLLNGKLKVAVSSLISRTETNSLGFEADNGQSNIFRNVFKGSPIVPVNWNGWTEEDKQIAFSDAKPINPLEILEKDDVLTTHFGITSNFVATYQITSDLSFTTQYGVKIFNTKNRHFLPQITNLVATDIQMGSAHINHSIYKSENFESILSYSKEFVNHTLKAIAVYSNNPQEWESFSQHLLNLFPTILHGIILVLVRLFLNLHQVLQSLI